MAANESALIIGAGKGLSASLGRLLEREGFNVALAARNPEKLETKGLALRCDATDRAQVEAAFEAVESKWGVPSLVIYNASYRTRGPFVELDVGEVDKSIRVTAFAGFLVAQSAAKRMLPRGSGAIFFTGASASVKGYANSAPFAMGKFALRGMAQSMARELSPKGIHIAHFVIDGGIGKDAGDAKLDPDEIARTYLNVYRQQRSAWTWEVELRPWVERF
ncbi:MAG TPA: SDR family NAD(P)-dependent oxidoreductase [Burkholderiales bacterium]|nr:SDR family NAD(P)-dependent oxidoreductase [Burkholderiales bacterium]